MVRFLQFAAVVGIACLLASQPAYVYAQAAATPVVATTGDVPVAEAPSGEVAATVNDVSESTGSDLVDAVINWLYGLAKAMSPIIIGAIAYFLKQRTGFVADQTMRDGFQTALDNAAGFLIQRLGVKAATLTNLDTLESEHVRQAITMVEKGAADAVKRWAIKPADIAKRIEAKLGLQTGVTDALGAPVTSARA